MLREDRWNGFSVELPEGWELHVQGERALAVPAGDPDVLVVFWPVLAPERSAIESLTAQALRELAAGAATAPQAWVRPPEPGPAGGSLQHVRFAQVSARGASLRGSLRVTLEPHGAGLVVGYRTRTETTAEGFATLEQVAASFRVIERVPRERHTDPSEGAWSIEVPAGWTVRGGVDRTQGYQGAGTVVWCVEDPRTQSRVQQTGTVVPMVAPDPTMAAWAGAMGGFGMTPMGAFNQADAWRTRPFMDAESFCRDVLLALARRAHPDLTLERTVPDASIAAESRRGLAGLEAQHGPASVSACLAFSRYTEGPTRFRECAVVVSWMLGAQRHWFVNVGPTLRAPEERFAELLPVLAGVARSFQANAAWEQREAGAIAVKMARERADAERYRAEKLRETQDYVHRVQREIAERHAATNAEIQRGAYNLIAGKEDVLDASNQSWKVDSGYETYWIHDDRIVGSNSAELDDHLRSDGWQRMRVF